MSGPDVPMSARKMHDDEVDLDEAVVRRLLAAQFPAWAELPLTRVASMGTVNAIFRLGDDMAVRLPRTPRWHDRDTELCRLRSLAPHLPIAIPQPLAAGEPDDEYSSKWAVFRWLDGEVWRMDLVDDPCRAAAELADFVQTLHRTDPAAMPCPPPPTLRPLAAVDHAVRAATAAAEGMVDTGALLHAWEAALDVPAWEGAPVHLHSDLLAGNVLVRDGRLAAVIDWAGVATGDPARDLMAAWTLFSGRAREVFRAAMAFDDDTWARARGWALTRISNVAYYAETNPHFSADARATIAEVLADHT